VCDTGVQVDKMKGLEKLDWVAADAEGVWDVGKQRGVGLEGIGAGAIGAGNFGNACANIVADQIGDIVEGVANWKVG